MRAEDIVGVSFFALLFAGIGFILYGASRNRSAAERTRLQGIGLLIEGVAFLAFGLISGYLIRISERPVVEGNIWAIQQTHGKSSGTNFRLTTQSGDVATIRCRYHGPGFREGDVARVRFVRYNEKLLELSMLSGPYEGWQLQESSGEGNTWFLAAIGVICGIAAYRQLRKSRPAIETAGA